MKFSIVIPCYNESEVLEELVSRCTKVAELGSGEFILVNNGSTDQTKEILAQLLLNNPYVRSVQLEENIGYGNGINFGLAHTDAPIIGWTHADLQADPEDVLKGFRLLEQSHDSFLKGLRKKRKLADKVFTLGMSIFESILLKRMLWDINAQPTMFHRNFYLSWGKSPDDFSLDLFAYFTAKKMKYKIIRIPVFFVERKYGFSSWNTSFFSRYRFIKRTIKYSLVLRRQEK